MNLTSTLKKTIESIEDLLKNIRKPFILNSGTLSNNFFDYKNQMTLDWAIFKMLSDFSGENNIYNIAKIVCDEDTEWTAWRNRDLKYPCYHRYTIKDEYADKLIAVVKKWQLDLQEILKQVEEKEKVEKQYKEERRKRFEIVKVYDNIQPRGGENGTDGFFDADVKRVSDGEVVRAIARNVFDFGFYVFPKRVGGSDEVFKKENWTEVEKEVCDWLREFSPFTTKIRM